MGESQRRSRVTPSAGPLGLGAGLRDALPQCLGEPPLDGGGVQRHVELAPTVGLDLHQHQRGTDLGPPLVEQGERIELDLSSGRGVGAPGIVELRVVVEGDHALDLLDHARRLWRGLVADGADHVGTAQDQAAHAVDRSLEPKRDLRLPRRQLGLDPLVHHAAQRSTQPSEGTGDQARALIDIGQLTDAQLERPEILVVAHDR